MRADGRQIFGTERLGALSDGVIAIALTLLVLEIKIPVVVEDEGIIFHIYEQLPHFSGWIISFVFIALVWHEQHLVFSHVRGTDTGFILLNLVQLACISLIPFGSAILGDFPAEPGSLIVFSVIMFGNALSMAASAAYVAGRVHLHERREAALLTRRTVFHVAAGSAATGVSVATAYLHDPLAGALAWMLVPLFLAAHQWRAADPPVEGAVPMARKKV